MKNEQSNDPQIKLKLRQFFENENAQDKVRQFFIQKNNQNDIIQVEEEEEPDDLSSDIELEVQEVNKPSIKLQVLYGSDFLVFNKQNGTTIKIDIDFFDSRHSYSYIYASSTMHFGIEMIHEFVNSSDENYVFNEDFYIKLIEKLIKYNNPIKFCISTDFPKNQFIGLATFDWRRIFNHQNGLLKEKIEITGLCNEVVGYIHISILLKGFEINLESFKELLKLQIKQEKIDDIEIEREFSKSMQIWWIDFMRLVEKKNIEITSKEIGSGRSIIFHQIVPFSIRNLDTPGKCLRYCHLLTDLIAPLGYAYIPYWASVASRSGRDREKVNVLVSLLRGFGLEAYVAVSSPRPIAICMYDADPENHKEKSILFFDVVSGKFGFNLPKIINRVSYIFNDEILLANLHPLSQKIDWDIKSPLKWKALHPPIWQNQKNDKIIPRCLKLDLYYNMNLNQVQMGFIVDEYALEYMVKKIIEEQRQSFCNNKTTWSYEIAQVLFPIVSSYEKQKQIGKNIENLSSAAIKRVISPFHTLKVVPALTNSCDPIEIFRSLMNTNSGLEILGIGEEKARFALRISVTQYPEGVYAVWSIFAGESIMPLKLNK
ncbi:Centrosomal protein of 76 kDa [Tritrichomonas musculus]|uniref:Centrosomal protein of 76 kDa n=1 Tax=Tritrichomonas musculus TaxID=1915356 RepID=A0ABR2IQX5_9EUKA